MEAVQSSPYKRKLDVLLVSLKTQQNIGSQKETPNPNHGPMGFRRKKGGGCEHARMHSLIKRESVMVYVCVVKAKGLSRHHRHGVDVRRRQLAASPCGQYELCAFPDRSRRWVDRSSLANE